MINITPEGQFFVWHLTIGVKTIPSPGSIVSGGQTQVEIEQNMKRLIEKYQPYSKNYG